MRNKSDFLVSVTVVLCSIVLLLALIFAITGNPFSKPALRFSVDFKDITGIQKNSPVLYSGDRVGFVERVEHLGPDDRVTEGFRVRAHVAVTRNLRLPANIAASIASETMLSEKHIALRGETSDEGLLQNGAKLTAGPPPSMLDDFLPGGGDIVANLTEITEDLKHFTDGLGKGEGGKSLSDTLAHLKTFTSDLKTAFAGTEEKLGIKAKIEELADKAGKIAAELHELLEGPEGKTEEGLSHRSKEIWGNIQSFSEELDLTLRGVPGKRKGLRQRLDDIAKEAHAVLVGDRAEKEGIHRILGKVNTLVEELNALIVWAEYITGTLAEKPNRVIFGNQPNDVPTKEQIINHLRATKEPYPVRIKANDPRGDPRTPLPATEASPAPKPTRPPPAKYGNPLRKR